MTRVIAGLSLKSNGDLVEFRKMMHSKTCLKSDPDLVGLSGSMFFVYDGNHRLLAWKEVIETLHTEDQHWVLRNGNPECVVLNTAGGRGNMLIAVHDINK